jgi:hypothetical protein
LLLAGYLVAGEALLFGLGLVREPGQGLRAAGAAVVLGWVVTVLTLTLGLLVGVDPRLLSAVAVWLVVIAAGLGLALRPGPRAGSSGCAP